MTLRRLIFHVDVNSAFLSWEATKRVKLGEPDLRLIPSAIGGERETRRGVILAKSIPAKKYGIKTGEPVGMALRKCPQLALAKPDFRLYEASSRAFIAVCRKYAPIVEQYSIDECFLDMSGTERIYPDPIAAAHMIKNEIRDTLGFTVNIGIGENKLCAKMASDFEKPDRVHTLFAHEIPQKMWGLPVRELFGVGSATAEQLIRHGLCKIGDAARCDVGTLISFLGVKQGEYIHRCANGVDDSPVLEVQEDAKGYSNSTTLEEDVTSYEAADAIMLALADSVTSRMRADGVRAYCVSASMRTSEFVNRSHQKKMPASTDITGEVYRVAVQLLHELWDGRTPLRLLGLSLTDIDRGDAEQLSLFPDEERERLLEHERQLDKTVDEIRRRFGSGTIKRGSVAVDVGKKHRAKAEFDADIEKEQ